MVRTPSDMVYIVAEEVALAIIEIPILTEDDQIRGGAEARDEARNQARVVQRGGKKGGWLKKIFCCF